MFQQLDERRGKVQEPFAVRTPLGWTFYGVPTPTEAPRVAFHVTTAQHQDDVLKQQLQLMWKTDFSDSLSNPKAAMSLEDKKALSIKENTLINEQNRYKLSLPWRNDPRTLPNNISLQDHASACCANAWSMTACYDRATPTRFKTIQLRGLPRRLHRKKSWMKVRSIFPTTRSSTPTNLAKHELCLTAQHDTRECQSTTTCYMDPTW